MNNLSEHAISLSEEWVEEARNLEEVTETMRDCRKFYIDGKWLDPTEIRDLLVFNPATEEPIATVSLGNATDVDKAVPAAGRAFKTYSETMVDQRITLLNKIIDLPA